MNSSSGSRFLAIVLPLAALLMLLAAGGADAQTNNEEVVYTDAAGVIRVYDYEPIANTPTIGWFSPSGGYTHVALIDVNLDGDMEIAALRPSDADTILDIFDPVIAPGDESQASGVINGIPWRLVNRLTFSGAPALLDAGNLDPSVDGAELLLATSANGDPAQQQLRMLRNIDGNGSTWNAIDLAIPAKFWLQSAVGDMDGDGVAEIGLVSKASATVEIWRVRANANVQRIYENPNPERPWHAIAMGDWLGNGSMMLGAVRSANPPFPALVIFRLQPNDVIEDYYTEPFSPAPEHIWFGDGNGTLDDEVFLLRSLPATDTVRLRLFSRNRGTDSFGELADRLDADNGYQAGTAGDVDGDGRDEVIIMRDNNMRIYLAPETTNSPNPTNVTITSDKNNLLAGDLDRRGFVQTVQLRAIADSITPTLPSGGSSVTDTVQIQNATNTLAIPFAQSIEGTPAWVSVAANQSVTPATLTFTYDATRLRPGTYRATVIVSAQSPLVSNNPLEIEISLVVTNGLLPEPNALLFASGACLAQPDQNQSLQLIAGAGTVYTASLVEGQSATAENARASETVQPVEANVTWPSSVPWLSATSPTGIAPEAMALTATFDDAPSEFAQAGVVVFGTLNGRSVVRTVAVYRLCVASRSWMPLLMR